MSESGLAGATPYARRQLVQLAKPYHKLIRDAIQAALNSVLDQIVTMLIISAYSPVPKDTGFLRSQLNVEIIPSMTGMVLQLSWPNVPYAAALISKAGQVNVRHAEPDGRYDPMAENPWMEPSMRMVFPLVLNALQQELTARGIEFTRG